MRINYSSRSKFFELIEQSIEEEGQELRAGQVIKIQLEPGGYNREARITINTNDPSGFDTDWSGSDPTRFSARIRAAATILFQKSYSGVFSISHTDGVMKIRRM